MKSKYPDWPEESLDVFEFEVERLHNLLNEPKKHIRTILSTYSSPTEHGFRSNAMIDTLLRNAKARKLVNLIEDEGE